MSNQETPRRFRREARYTVHEKSEPLAWVRRSEHEPWQTVRLLDLSRHGLRMELGWRPQIGTSLDLRLGDDNSSCQAHRRLTIRWAQISARGNWWVGCELQTALEQEVIDHFARAGHLERRRHPRFVVRRAVKVRWQLMDQWQDAELYDFSSEGFQLRMPNQMAAGTSRILMRLEPTRPGGRPIEIPARIIWQMPMESGQCFGCAFVHHHHYTEFRQAVRPPGERDTATPTKRRWHRLRRRRVTAVLLVTLVAIGISSWIWLCS